MWTNDYNSVGRPCLPFTLIFSLVFIIIFFYKRKREERKKLHLRVKSCSAGILIGDTVN